VVVRRASPAPALVDERPLFGKRIVVTSDRASRRAELVDLRGIAGTEAIEAPMIRMRRLTITRPLDEAITRAGSYDWILFTSATPRMRSCGGFWAGRRHPRSQGVKYARRTRDFRAAREIWVTRDLEPAEYC